MLEGALGGGLGAHDRVAGDAEGGGGVFLGPALVLSK